MGVIFEYVRKREVGEPGFLDSVASMYARNARLSNFALRVAIEMVGLLLRPREKSVKYYFWGTKFEELIVTLPSTEVCVIGGPKQLFFCLKQRRAFLPCMTMWGDLLSGLRSSNTQPLKSLQKKIDALALNLNNRASHDAVLILDNDSMPMQRAVGVAAKKCCIQPVICIQDGVFQSKSPGSIMHGWFSDLFFVINEQQRLILIDKGMNPNKVKVMGFHSSPYVPVRPLSPPQLRKICVIGQPWTKYGKERGQHYLKIVTHVSEILRSHGHSVYYKPHPWEVGASYLDDFDDVLNIPLYEAFEIFDVFISITSTALLEAKSSGRVAIQITDSMFDADDFSAYGGIASIEYNNSNLEGSLMQAVKNSSIVIVDDKNPVERFTYLIENEMSRQLVE